MRTRILALSCALAVLAPACIRPGPNARPIEVRGPGESELDLVAWPGTVEDGSNDPRVDWVHPFERQTGCSVTVRYVNSAEELVGLLRQRGSFDGGLVSSDVAGRLIMHGDVAALDTRLLPGLARFVAPLRRPAFVTTRGQLYGVPFEYGPNLLVFNSAVIRRPPTSWRVTWTETPRLSGHVVGYAASIYLADAALYLRAHDRALGIKDPYELTARQLDAATQLAIRQTAFARNGWAQFSDEISAFASRELLAGVARPIVLDLTRSVPLRAVVPREGVTGWVDSWMMTSHPAHPNCMYRWMQWTTEPAVQAGVAQWYGAAPSNPAACPVLRRAVGPSADTLRYGKCGDVRFLRSLRLWRTPSSDCGDGRHDCTDYRAWLRAWASVRGASSTAGS